MTRLTTSTPVVFGASCVASDEVSSTFGFAFFTMNAFGFLLGNLEPPAIKSFSLLTCKGETVLE